METSKINRRQFIRYAALGVTGVAVAGVLGERVYQALQPAPRTIRLAITDATVEMVDHTPVYHWLFEDLNNPTQLPQFPGPLIEAVEGDKIKISITNNLPDPTVSAFPAVPVRLAMAW